MQHNTTQQPITGTSLLDRSRERYPRSENDLSAPGYQQGVLQLEDTVVARGRQSPQPHGAVNNTGFNSRRAVTVEDALPREEPPDQDEGLMTPPTGTDVLDPEGDSAFETDGDSEYLPEGEGSSRSDSPGHADLRVEPTPPRPTRMRKPLVQVATLNVRGLGDRRRSDRNKLQTVIKWMREEKVGVLALQETYDCTEIFEAAERFNEKIWAFPNKGDAHSAGTGFLMHRDSLPADLRKEDVDHEILIPGRLATLSWRWGETDLRIANLYAPGAPQVAEPFFRRVTDLLKTKETSMVLGDWNHVESAMDRSSRAQSTSAVREALSDLRRTLAVEDAWREENPTTCDFTWESPNVGATNQTSRSRIDRILLSEQMSERATEHVIDVGLTVSDHYPVRVKIIDDEAPDIGRGRWKMNLEDLEDDFAMEKCRAILLKCERRSAHKPMTAWLQAKRSIKAVLTQRQTMRRKERSKLLDDLESQRKAILARRDYRRNHGLIAMESNLRERIAAIKSGKRARATESSSARFAEKGEAVNKFWFSIGRSMRESSLIKALTDDDDEPVRETDRMAGIARSHHAALQAAPDMTPERFEACRRMATMAEGKTFSEEAREDIDADISREEVEDVIMSTQGGKSPGRDGLPYEFYKYWVKRLRTKRTDDPKVPDIAGILARVWNDIGDGRTPPCEYVEGLMFLLYKKKRRDKVENYRPITLLGCDYKMHTKILANRLGRNVSTVLHPDQAGFVPGRDIIDHVRLAKHVKELCDTTERDGALVALDQEKAYDRIDHDYLWGMLEAYGAPLRFIDTVRGLYANATTRVLLNQSESEPFDVERGVRQGDPLSCLLFNLAIEPLAESLRRSSLKGISIPNAVDRLVVRLFADDTQLYLSKFDRWSKVRQITEDWCLASTAKFNQEKTEVLPMGSHRYRKDVCRWRCIRPERIQTSELLPRGARMVEDGQPLRILGGIVGHKVDEASIWEPVVTKIETLSDKWSKKRLTFRGRRLIISFLVQSKAQYMLSTNDPPSSVIKRVAKATHSIMWAGRKRGLTTMDVVERPLDEGGLGVPNFELRTQAARLMAAKKWCAPAERRPLWAAVVDEMIRLSSKKPDDGRKRDVLLQTWRETSGKTSTLPRDVQAMLKTLRGYDVRLEVLKLSHHAKGELPIWQSRTTELSPKEENSAPMRALRKTHHVQNMADLERVTFRNTEGCKKHLKCMEALDEIVRKTVPKANVRFQTPLLGGAAGPDGLSFTHRRREKANRDFREGKPVAFDPSITYKGDLRGALRVFSEPMPNHTTPAFRTGAQSSDLPAIELWTDGSTTDFGKASQRIGFGIWSQDEALCVASRLTTEDATNNAAELAALMVALASVPKERSVRIMTDSMYVLTGYHKTRHLWEDQGWLGVPNKEMWQKVIYLGRTRTGSTEVLKVEAHTGIHGNEEADRLAKKGAEGAYTMTLDTEVPAEWALRGAKLTALTYPLAYEWARRSGKSGKATSSQTNVLSVLDELRHYHDITTTEAKLWRSLRKPYIRREISDFLWTMIHGRSQCGTAFSKWGPDWEDLQYCECGAVESMEHILTVCNDAAWKNNIWREASRLLRKTGAVPSRLCRRPSFSEIMGLGLIDAGNRVATRTWATIVSETAFMVWKLRNRRRFDQVRISTAMAVDLWKGSLEKRARTDLALQRLGGPKTQAESLRAADASTVWSRVLSTKGGVTIWNYADHG